MWLLPEPKAPTELIVGRMNVDRREFWSLSSDAKPRRILSERITPKLVLSADDGRYVAQPADLVRCALSPKGDRLLLVDGQDWIGTRVVVRLSEWSLRGRRLGEWKYVGKSAEPLYAGYEGDRPSWLLFRETPEGRSGLDEVWRADWRASKERRWPRGRLPAFVRLLPPEASGTAPDWPLATPRWMPVGLRSYHFDGLPVDRVDLPGIPRRRTLRMLWQGAESPWRVEGNALVGPKPVVLPMKDAALTQIVQAGPEALVAIFATRPTEGDWIFAPFRHPQEVWWFSAEAPKRGWSPLIDGEWVTVRGAGGDWPMRWPDVSEPDRYGISRTGKIRKR